MIEEATVVEAETEEQEVVETPARDYEKEARESGWVPEAEFKGERKPAKFLDAEEFVKRGEELTPFIRKENKQLKQALDETKADFAKRIERMEKANAKAFETAQRQHDAELARVRREQRAAVESGDAAEFDRLETERSNLEKAAPKADEPEKVDPAATLAQKQEAWRAANPWFDEDFDMQEFAIKYSDFHGRKHPNMSFEDNMKVVEAEVRKKFPDKFGGKKPNGHSAVDSGGDFLGFAGKGKKTWVDLPSEAKAAGANFITQGLFKDQAAYAKAYFEEN
jgi:hypothetical protein